MKLKDIYRKIRLLTYQEALRLASESVKLGNSVNRIQQPILSQDNLPKHK